MNGQDPNTAKPDPFDPQSLRINAMTDIDVEQVLTAVPVRKPKRTDTSACTPATITRCPACYVMERDTGTDTESYLVTPEVQHLVSTELRPMRLFTAINKRGTVFLWPIKLPNDDNDRIRRIADTALQCAEQAKTLWVKMHWEPGSRRVRDAAGQGRSGRPAMARQAVPRSARIGLPGIT